MRWPAETIHRLSSFSFFFSSFFQINCQVKATNTVVLCIVVNRFILIIRSHYCNMYIHYENPTLCLILQDEQRTEEEGHTALAATESKSMIPAFTQNLPANSRAMLVKDTGEVLAHTVCSVFLHLHSLLRKLPLVIRFRL